MPAGVLKFSRVRPIVHAVIGGSLLASATLFAAQDVPAAASSSQVQGSEPVFMVSAEAAPLPSPQNPLLGEGQTNAALRLRSDADYSVSAVPRRFQYAFRLNMRAVYDDNIFLRHAGRIGDFYFALEPGVTLGFGDIVGKDQNYVRLDYAPSLFIYGDNSDANGLQHLIRLDGQYRFGHLSATLTQEVQILEGASQSANLGSTSNPNTGPAFNLDAGGNTQVNIYNTQANLSYDLTGKTFLSGGLTFTAYDYETLISSEMLSGNLFVNYTYSPKLVVGLGGTAGYNWVDNINPNQSFQQVNVRATYQATGKLSLNASGGIEFRQFEGNTGGGDYVSPVYEIGVTYQPFDGTTLNLHGSRRTLNSAVLLAQDYASTNITFSARQRFLHRTYIGFTAGYENSDYFGTVDLVDSSRSDNYFFLQPSFDVTITRFWTAGLYYLHRQNDSSSDNFSFYDNQFGFRTSLTF